MARSKFQLNNDLKSMEHLRDAGYLIVIWSPEELVKVDNIDHLGDAIVSHGNELIEGGIVGFTNDD